MQALLSQRGKARKKVLKRRWTAVMAGVRSGVRRQVGLPFRTIQDHITGLRRNGKSGPSQSKRKDDGKRSKPWHANAKESRALAGAQLAINDLIAAYEAGVDMAPAYQQYKKVAVSPTKLSDYVESAKRDSNKADVDAEVKRKLVPVVESGGTVHPGTRGVGVFAVCQSRRDGKEGSAKAA